MTGVILTETLEELEDQLRAANQAASDLVESFYINSIEWSLNIPKFIRSWSGVLYEAESYEIGR